MSPPLRRPGGALATATKVWAVARITTWSRLTHYREVLVRTAFVAVMMFVFSHLWGAVARHGALAGTGFTVAELIWYVAFTQAMAGSNPVREVDREIRSGEVAYRLARPFAYPLHHFGRELSERMLRFAMTLPVTCALALIIAGPVALRPLAVLAAVVAAVGAFLAEFLIGFALSLLAFWLEDTDGVMLIWRRLTMILGGLLIPLETYPAWLERLARALPFSHLLYAPARLFVAQDAAALVPTLAAQLAIGVVALAPLWLLYRLGVRRLSANGG